MVFSKTFLFIAHSRNVKFYTLDSLVLHTSGAVYFKLFQMNLNWFKAYTYHFCVP